MAVLLSSSSSSSSSSFTYAFSYDVFLSFRGTDTRFGFTGNLHKALCDKGIRTFIDDEDLKRGDEITPTLIKAIQESRIAIPIFSVNYAFSSFCLDELVTIIECIKANGRLVFPVFYDVDPSHVRHQRETYAEALAQHEKRFQDSKENMERLQKWKFSLYQAANLSGLHFKPREGYESEFIGKIVKEVSRKINHVALPIADYPVGLEPQVRKVIRLLDVESHDEVQMVGIHGIGGVGKTTLSLAVYNSIADHFEGLCFLENVRENYKKKGLLHLQKTLLSAVLGENIEITSVKQGIAIIQQRLQQKKVLLILDDVEEEEQLKHIIGASNNWFGPGSRVIITTRNQHLLVCHKVERTHKVEELNKEDAFELLKWKAFKDDEVRPSYVDMLNRAVAYASGLPLALEVIGSNLYGKSVQEWKSALDQYRRIPDQKIQNILKVSYDALEEEEQSVFLDIACCFKGYELKDVENILNAHHDQCIKYHIGVLVEKSLIKITGWNDDQVTLHDLIEDMGKEIVRQESPKDPGNRSRLWSQKDIFEVLEENTGTSKIEMIHLDYVSSKEVNWDGKSFKEINWDGKSFKKMIKLKTLTIRKSHFSKSPEYLPNSLRVLEWWEYPSQHFPCDFHPKKLSICKLPKSSLMSLELLSSSKMKFVQMKVLNLDRCQHLTQLPDLSSLPNLEELSFINCKSLITIDHPVWSSDKLKIVDATGCDQLRRVPPLNLPSLEKLYFNICTSLESFPEILEKMENVTELGLHSEIMLELPSSFRNLTGLQDLTVCGWQPSRILAMLSQLSELEMRCSGTLEIEDAMSSMAVLESSKVEILTLVNPSNGHLALVPSFFPNLKELILKGDTFTIVPECIKQCRFLGNLRLDYCKQLREIEGIPPRLRYLTACRCSSLSLSCRSMLLNKELHVAGEAEYTYFVFPSPERVPEWFEHQSSMGPSPSLSFWFRYSFPAHKIILCLLSPPPLPLCTGYYNVTTILNGKTIYDEDVALGYTHLTRLRHIYNVEEVLLENEWNHVKIDVSNLCFYYSLERIRSTEQISEDFGIGIHVLNNMEDIRFTCPYKKKRD